MKPTHALLILFTSCLMGAQPAQTLDLPQHADNGVSLAQAFMGRRTVRALAGPAPSAVETSQLLWAAQGENRPGKRTVPSAKAKFPIEIYLVTAGSDTLPGGIYHYRPSGHQLIRLADGSPSATLAKVDGMQSWIAAAPAVFVVAGVPTRINPSGKDEALYFTYYEGGAAAQDLLLEAKALNLEAGTAAGLNMPALATALDLPKDNRILTVLPVGHGK